ncbi:MAG: hypothetical protein ABI361_05775 [Nitrososphaera sp.]|jgi:hypothetical protein
MLLGGCLDLGISKPESYRETAEMLSGCGMDFVVMMEDRQPDFFLSYDGYRSDAYVRLNRHGPHDSSSYHPTQSDLRRFVRLLNDSGIEVMYGFWVHENRWVATRHPELLLTDTGGHKWHSSNFSYDFNPLLEFGQDDEYYGVKRGDPFDHYVCRQYRRLSDDFGFTGLFVGDGGMGFRVFANETAGVNTFDYSSASISKFIGSRFCQTGTHRKGDVCLLEEGRREPMTDWTESLGQKLAMEIANSHIDEFAEWNCSEWARFYRTLSVEVRREESKGRLGAYTCMNYGPAMARLHGVDYKAIAAAGLDYLVFQSYSYAWGKHFGLAGKDTRTNLEQLRLLRADLDGETRASATSLLVTAETGDSVENWSCPAEHTLSELRTYVGSGHGHRRRADGAFIVWLNETPAGLIRDIGNTMKSG